MVEEIKPLDEPLDKVLDELMDGDILVFQLADPEILSTKDDFATARGYFRYFIQFEGHCYLLSALLFFQDESTKFFTMDILNLGEILIFMITGSCFTGLK